MPLVLGIKVGGSVVIDRRATLTLLRLLPGAAVIAVEVGGRVEQWELHGHDLPAEVYPGVRVSLSSFGGENQIKLAFWAARSIRILRSELLDSNF